MGLVACTESLVSHTSCSDQTPSVPRRQCKRRKKEAADGFWSILDASNTSNTDDYEVTSQSAQREHSHTFRMGNFEALKLFLGFRMDELTVRFLRPIVIEWLKLLEPTRPKKYGPYHKCRPSEAPENASTPPWWPEDCHYNDPSHLSKTGIF